MEGYNNTQLHMLLFPFMAYGHLIPMLDIAKMLASRGIKISIITTSLNSISISKSVQNFKSLSFASQIKLLTINFPYAQVGLPNDFESLESILSPTIFHKFILALNLLEAPFEDIVFRQRPHCIVVDMVFPWGNAVASKFGIPRLNFHGSSFISICASELLRIHQPYNHVSSETDPFLIPYFPGEFTFTLSKLPPFLQQDVNTDISEYVKKVQESGAKSYGVVMNSFYELEAAYVDCYKHILRGKSWSIGPVSLYNDKTQEKVQRGSKSSIDEYTCLKWLESKRLGSVVYVCFGSLISFNLTQLKEIAKGLEASGKSFIWVVRRVEENENLFLESFEKKMKEKGLIIREWAPQVLILDHPAVGGFVTHCGWNSTIEGVAAGVPMVTWPMTADQFYNETLVTKVCKIGVSVGIKKWMSEGDIIKYEVLENAINKIMEGEEAKDMRNKAKELREMGKNAFAENGSSHSNLDALINEMESLAFR